MANDINVTINETDTIFVTITGGIAAASTYSHVDSFVDGDLSSGILTVTHNLNVEYPLVQIYNSNKKLVSPDDVTYVDSNSSLVDLSSWGPIEGTWHLIIMGGN